MAAEEDNRGGGPLGHGLVVRTLDDQSDNSTALAYAGKVGKAIKRGDRIASAVGNMDGGPASSALPHCEEMGLELISPPGGLGALTNRGHRSFFRENASDKVQAGWSARFPVEESNAWRVAVVHDGTEYGSNLALLPADHLRIFGARTAVQVALEAEQQDFSPLVQLVGNGVRRNLLRRLRERWLKIEGQPESSAADSARACKRPSLSCS